MFDTQDTKKEPQSTSSASGASVSASSAGPAKKRSPAHPRVRLEEAIGQARKLYDEANAHNYDVPFTSAASLLGIASVKSDAFRALVTSLKYFGLARQSQGSTGKTLRLTDRARAIVADLRIESPERDAAIRDAALSPRIYKLLWDEWQQKGEPAPDVLEHNLEHELGFNRNSIDGFLSDFRANLSFARLKLKDTSATDSASVPDSSPQDEVANSPSVTEDVHVEGHQNPVGKAEKNADNLPDSASDVFDSVLSIDDSLKTSFRVPKDLSPAGFRLLEQAVAAHLKLIAVRLGIPTQDT